MMEEEFKQWYRTCIYIEYEMSIIDFKDFMKNAIAIKNLYQQLKIPQQRMYKWYVYANIDMKLKQKDAIWRFLNNEIFYSDLKNFK